MKPLFTPFVLLLGVFGLACGGTVNEGSGGAGGGASTSTGSPECNCDAYFPVCGVDGQTYNAGCGDDCVAVEIACRNECPCVSCPDIVSAYTAKLAEAKACNPAVDALQCTLEVPDAVECPCSTYVNPGNADAVAELEALRASFEAQACGSGVCPAVECEAPTGGSCAPGGACEDLFAQR